MAFGESPAMLGNHSTKSTVCMVCVIVQCKLHLQHEASFMDTWMTCTDAVHDCKATSKHGTIHDAC